MLSDGTDRNRQLRQFQELLRNAIQFLELRSARADGNIDGNFGALMDFLDSLEDDENMSERIDSQLMHTMIAHILSTNANINNLLEELEHRKQRAIVLQKELKQARHKNQQKRQINGAVAIRTTSGIWKVEDSH